MEWISAFSMRFDKIIILHRLKYWLTRQVIHPITEDFFARIFCVIYDCEIYKTI